MSLNLVDVLLALIVLLGAFTGFGRGFVYAALDPPTIAGAHEGLMNSSGHRANILRKQFGRAGIGILDGGRRGLMVTQEFRN